MKHQNPWKGPVEGMPPGGVFPNEGEVMIDVVAIGTDWQDLQYTPVVHVHAGDSIDDLRTAAIEWIESHSNDSLPGVQSVDYTVLGYSEGTSVMPETEAMEEEQAFTREELRRMSEE